MIEEADFARLESIVLTATQGAELKIKFKSCDGLIPHQNGQF